MVWNPKTSDGNEQAKIKWEIVPYTRGRGLDLGCGPNKAFPHFIGIDNGHHERFGYAIKPDLLVDTCEDLSIFGSQSMDFVFSSHLLEHIIDYKSSLKEWWRLIKTGGHLVLYLPHKDFYPNIGVEGANPDHKHDFMPQDIIDAMLETKGFDLLENQERNEGDEYSFLQVYKKLNNKSVVYSWDKPKPEKTAAIIRYGAFGDLMQASSVVKGLKDQGYHVTIFTSPPGSDVVINDPNIDRFFMQDRDQVPNGNLGEFWNYWSKRFDKFVNLSESVEGTLLAITGRANFVWPHEVRHKQLNQNYLEFQHALGQVPHKPQVKFYPTLEEKEWARKQRSRMGDFVIMWSLAGSSLHKVWPYVDGILARVLIEYPRSHVVLVGGPDTAMLEAGWENEPRIHKTCGKWSIRQSLSFIYEADLIVGPETGVLNAACCMDVPKICLLSHSSVENLTRDWTNTISLFSKTISCYPCHQLHMNSDGWKHCKRDVDPECNDCSENEIRFGSRACAVHTGQSACQASVKPHEMWDAIRGIMDKALRLSA